MCMEGGGQAAEEGDNFGSNGRLSKCVSWDKPTAVGAVTQFPHFSCCGLGRACRVHGTAVDTASARLIRWSAPVRVGRNFTAPISVCAHPLGQLWHFLNRTSHLPDQASPPSQPYLCAKNSCHLRSHLLSLLFQNPSTAKALHHCSLIQLSTTQPPNFKN